MSKVEEKIKKYSNAVSANVAAAIFNVPIDSKVTQAIKEQHKAFIKALEEIQTEQEELQKKADKYDELSKPVEISDAEWDEDDIILIMTEFHDEYLVDSENPVEISIKYAHKLIDLFQAGVAAEIKRQNEPIQLPKWIVEEYFEENPSGWVSTVVTHVMSDGRMGKDSKMIAADAREVEKILCVAFATGNYTVKQKSEWVITNGSRYLEEVIWRSRERAISKGPAFHEELWHPDKFCAIKFDDEEEASSMALLVDGNAVKADGEEQ